MNTIVVTPQSESEYTFLLHLFQKLQVKADALTHKKKATSRLSLKRAADLMYNDYCNDTDLTAFSQLDSDDFHETR
jgi:hypothetical protein